MFDMKASDSYRDHQASNEELKMRVAELEAQVISFAEEQREFKRSMNFLESLLRSIPNPVFWKDTDGRYLGCNPAFTEIMGVDAKQIRGKTVYELWPSEQARVYHQKDLELIKNPQQQTYEFEVKDKEGKLRPVVYHKNVFRDDKGAVIGLVGSFVDIGDIRQAHEEIVRRQQFLESVLYHAPDAIVTLDEQQRVTDWNPGAVKMFGYTSEEAIGSQLDDLVAPRHQPDEVIKKLAQALSGNRVEAFETIRYRKNGTPLHVIVSGSPIIIDGVLKGVVAVYTDITDRVRNEEALKTYHQRFITVLDSIDATIYVADMKTHEILFMNKNMIETFGGDLTGKICWNVFRKELGPCPNCTNEQLVDDKGQPTGLVVWQDKNPVTGRWYINYDRAIEWVDGRIVRLQIGTDITDYKKMEESLINAQKMEAIGTLASGIAHDFNNLLMGIQGRTSLISVDLEPGHAHAEHTTAIEEHIRSATSLTNQLLGAVRGGKYDVKPLDINALLKSTAEMFGRTRKQIRILTKTKPHPVVVNADKRQIEQVLLNIYVNAWQAMPDGGDLVMESNLVELNAEDSRIHQVSPGAYVKLSVTDTGIGMTEEIRLKVFDPFFTTKEKERGTGLGLASAYGIIRNHGGTITVYSKVGQGSRFNIYLPITLEHLTLETQQIGDLICGTETILLVDDEAMILEVGKAMLERLGYRVVIAESGEKAVASLSKMGSDINLVILDLVMPDFDGEKTFNRVRELSPTVPVILSSGYSINGKASEIMKRGCNAFIQKPFSISELAKTIRAVLERVVDTSFR
jgi:two-component system cell cycle sensor histidine kinase/response regulator CckA